MNAMRVEQAPELSDAELEEALHAGERRWTPRSHSAYEPVYVEGTTAMKQLQDERDRFVAPPCCLSHRPITEP
ncbi:hypothetical protein [Variovorax sp. WS11]|nr:hypothetical protein [Variovorax sp. WS11]NDZ18828.1 hypothetical protein [Variovorax sp. WS11]